MPEWLMGTDCKSVDFVYAGSNLARPTSRMLGTGSGNWTRSSYLEGKNTTFMQYPRKNERSYGGTGRRVGFKNQ